MKTILEKLDKSNLSELDIEIALKISKLLHEQCKDVPHDIGLQVLNLVKDILPQVDEKVRLSDMHGNGFFFTDFIPYALGEKDNTMPASIRFKTSYSNDYLEITISTAGGKGEASLDFWNNIASKLLAVLKKAY